MLKRFKAAPAWPRKGRRSRGLKASQPLTASDGGGAALPRLHRNPADPPPETVVQAAGAALAREPEVAEGYSSSSEESERLEAQLFRGTAAFCVRPDRRQRGKPQRRESDQRYRALFESTDQGLCVLEVSFDARGRGVDYRFLEVNSAFERHTGLRGASGRTVRELVPDLEPHWPEVYGRIATTGQRERFVSQSAAMGRWFEVDAFRIGKPGARQVGVLFTDITRRQRTEGALRLANDALRQADQRKDEFLAILAHELRNPLAGLVMASSLFQRPDLDTEKTQQVRAICHRQLDTLTRLVDDLLDVSRITRGQVQLRSEPVVLGAVIADALHTVRPLLEDKQHQVRMIVSDEPVWVIGDPVRLEQILTNLLANAGKYTDAGGHIEVRLEVLGQHVELRVTDTGIGVEPDMLQHIFTLFGQDRRGEARSQGGLGIGLTLVKGLVEQHGGRIRVASGGTNQGSEFTITLPLAPADAATPTAEPPAPERLEAGSIKSILVVDDNADVAGSLAMLLELSGHRVVTASDGPAGLALAAEVRPDLVLLDIGLPGMDGYEVARRLRQHPSTRHTVLAALTGYGRDEDLALAREAGFDRHFVKPIDTDQLRALIDTV